MEGGAKPLTAKPAERGATAGGEAGKGGKKVPFFSSVRKQGPLGGSNSSLVSWRKRPGTNGSPQKKKMGVSMEDFLRNADSLSRVSGGEKYRILPITREILYRCFKEAYREYYF